jgi:MFS family permease
MKSRPAIPRTVWTLGFVSLCMDLSSELVHSLLPIFLVTTLGASALAVGFIEGIAEATALVAKVFSGAISDFFRRRKALILLGYGLAALTKPLFPLATTVEAVFTARFLDRIGKGIRGAPRDALVAEAAPAEIRGACFGLRQSMDTVGAVLGPALAMALMLVFAGQIRLVLWFAVLPAFAAVALIVFGVEETEDAAPVGRKFRAPIRWSALREFSDAYWRIVAVGAVFTLARFSEAFLVLRAQDAGLGGGWAPLVMVVMSLVYALSAYPAGFLSDRMSRRMLLGSGIAVLVAADLVLAGIATPAGVLAGAGVWGLHMGLTQGILAAMVADAAPKELKGTAFGIFNLAGGVCALLASVLAGGLWQAFGGAATFEAGAALALVSLAALLVLPGRRA